MSNFKLYDSSHRAVVKQNHRFAIVAARFNSEIVDLLLQGAESAFLQSGVTENQIEVVRVPGAYEIPLACQKLAASGKFDALIALGCIIRGDTPHFEYVCTESARGVMNTGLKFGIPIINGILTVDNIEQAQQRAQKDQDNKGVDAVYAALEMLDLCEKLKQQ